VLAIVRPQARADWLNVLQRWQSMRSERTRGYARQALGQTCANNL